MKKKKKIFLVWLCLVVMWNYGVPGAAPIYDVLVAVALSFFVKVLESHV
tara:strand:- start:197 stop:343 length:147 start_codon:yes stop_codon:yes gene_type:complete